MTGSKRGNRIFTPSTPAHLREILCRHGEFRTSLYIAETRILALLATIDLACDRMSAARTEDPIVQAGLVVEEFGKIVEAKRLYDAAVEAQA